MCYGTDVNMSRSSRCSLIARLLSDKIPSMPHQAFHCRTLITKSYQPTGWLMLASYLSVLLGHLDESAIFQSQMRHFIAACLLMTDLVTRQNRFIQPFTPAGRAFPISPKLPNKNQPFSYQSRNIILNLHSIKAAAGIPLPPA